MIAKIIQCSVCGADTAVAEYVNKSTCISCSMKENMSDWLLAEQNRLMTLKYEVIMVCSSYDPHEILAPEHSGGSLVSTVDEAKQVAHELREKGGVTRVAIWGYRNGKWVSI